jgi:hypothetical protein
LEWIGDINSCKHERNTEWIGSVGFSTGKRAGTPFNVGLRSAVNKTREFDSDYEPREQDAALERSLPRKYIDRRTVVAARNPQHDVRI